MEDFVRLNLPIYKQKLKLIGEIQHIFDEVRKKYILLTKEEWVRQNFIHYLKNEKGYPFGLMNVEKTISYNNMRKRADIVIYNTTGLPFMIVECKSTDVKITKDVFYQICRYNYKLGVKYLVLTNGLDNFCCEINYKEKRINLLSKIPNFNY
ncbi:MAG: restriction endonuclease subunit R [Flavobacteriales bacterium]|nr:restriction endonuclease subunit R [Flavobacteriales bacterium]|tara:strand:+ start:13 stop:468 length:456 start_codon:yes stop_codon:yes gene_type:complete